MNESSIEKKNLEEILEEDAVSFDKSEEFDIKYWAYNRSVAELYDMYINEEIVIPDLQREYVWSYEQASLFIDSILRGLPIPSFFVTEINGKILMIDGLQRLHTLKLFKSEQKFNGWTKAPKDFPLMNKNDILEVCAGKSYKQLDYFYQRRLDRAMMNIIEFNQVSPSENYSAMYQIFERINSTGRALEPQEVRNAAYYSKFNRSINEFANNDDFKAIYDSKKAVYRTEILVRWLTVKSILELKNKGLYNKKQINLKNDMNEFMAIFQAVEFNLPIKPDKFPIFNSLFSSLNFIYENEIEKIKKVIEWIRKNIGENAFCNIKETPEKSITYKNTLHPTLTEGLFLACYYSYDYLINNDKDYRSIVNSVIATSEYQEKLSKQTTTIESIEYRINKLINAFRG